MNRLLEVDAIRGIAALGIVLFHYASSSKWHDHHIYHYFSYLEECLQVFFIISGFVVLISIKRISRSLDFIVARFARLYPMYLFSVITTVIITNITRIAEPRTEKITDIICNFLLIQDFVGAKSVNIVYWTLTLEICFYIMILIIYKLKAVKYIDIICGVWIVLIFINVVKATVGNVATIPDSLLDSSVLSSYAINRFSFPYYIGTLTFPHLPISVVNVIGFFKDFIKTNFMLMQGRAVFFIAGIMLYQIKIMGFSWYRIMIIGLCLLAKGFDYAADAHSYSVVFFAVYLLIIYAAISDKLPILARKPLVFLGTISYSLYLIHLQVGWLIKSDFLLDFLGIPAEVSIIIKASVAVAVASFLTFTMEIPAMNFIKSFYKKRLVQNVG